MHPFKMNRRLKQERCRILKVSFWNNALDHSSPWINRGGNEFRPDQIGVLSLYCLSIDRAEAGNVALMIHDRVSPLLSSQTKR